MSLEIEHAFRRIFVVARHNFYLEDAQQGFNAIDKQIIVSQNLESIRADILSDCANTTVFFPHYSRIIDVKEYSGVRLIGFHTGNLPEDRGGSPIQNKILKGEYQTHVSAIKLEDKIDSGAIYTSRAIDLSYGNIEEILRRISKLITDMMIEISTTNLIPIAQDRDTEPTKRIEVANSELPIQGNARQIYDRIRMVDGLDYPKAFIRKENHKIYFENAQLVNDELTAQAVFKFGEDK
jgi:methionyl-tRNA formyltransferase